MNTASLYDIFQCPETGIPLKCQEDRLVRPDGKSYPIVDGIPRLVYPETSANDDARWQQFYNWFAPFYDLNERVMGGFIARIDVKAERERLISLIGLQPGATLLEVSPGPGVYYNALHKTLGTQGTHVAADLSLGMLREYRKRTPHGSPLLV